MEKTYDLNLLKTIRNITPNENRKAFPQSEKSIETVLSSRKTTEDIMNGNDDRLMVAMGPCSINTPEEAFEYAEKLKELQQRVYDRVFLVMRSYFEKPRTNGGWKGIMTQPAMNEVFDFNNGVQLARFICNRLTEAGVPIISELLDTTTAKHIVDFLVNSVIGARSVSNSTHHDIASGLSTRTWIKHFTDGDVMTAINAMIAINKKRSLLTIDNDGFTSTIVTGGNPRTNLVLRGGNRPNYDSCSIRDALELLEKYGLNKGIIVDCSHANSKKDYREQGRIFKDVVKNRVSGMKEIKCLMLESNLFEGKQDLPDFLKLDELVYGVSVTDACIGWKETEALILWAYEQLGNAESGRKG